MSNQSYSEEFRDEAVRQVLDRVQGLLDRSPDNLAKVFLDLGFVDLDDLPQLGCRMGCGHGGVPSGLCRCDFTLDQTEDHLFLRKKSYVIP